MPVNALIVRALLNLYNFYGDEFKVQCPTGSGRYMTLFEVAQEICPPAGGHFPARCQWARRPVYGGTAKFQDDPHWRDLILFYEYFHGDNGAGLGASHQTGWTGLVAPLLDLFGRIDAKDLETEREQVVAGDKGAGGRRKDGRELRSEYVRSSLSCAVPNQHPRLADRTIPQLWASARRWMIFRTPSWTVWPRWGLTGSGS